MSFRCSRDCEGVGCPACAEIARLRDDNARLRALIKAQEWSAGLDAMECPWCEGTSDTSCTSGIGHRADCPVFTPDGAVR